VLNKIEMVWNVNGVEQNVEKVEIHYCRNRTTKQVFDLKAKHNYWHQKPIERISYED